MTLTARCQDSLLEIAGRHLAQRLRFREGGYGTARISGHIVDPIYACRVRTHRAYTQGWTEDFTVRYSTQTGAAAEYQRLLDKSWAHYLIYGFASPGDLPPVIEYAVINVIRLADEILSGRVQGRVFGNQDLSQGIAFRYDQMPPGIIELRAHHYQEALI